LRAIVAVCGALAAAPAPAGAATFGELVVPTGPEAIVFDGPGPCGMHPGADMGHTVDGTSRTFRDARGRVQVMLPQGNSNRRLIGTSLDDLTPDCQVVHPLDVQGDTTPPSSYANNPWLPSVYRHGSGIYALVHNEYQGSHTDPPDCTTTFGECWMSSITSAVSTDDGESYANGAPPPGHLVAALPYRYEPDWGRHGYRAPTSIVAHPTDGHYYAMITASATPSTTPTHFRDQELGVCVIRTPSLESPPWRAWNGTSFSTQFANPYDPGFDPGTGPPNHTCKPVSTSREKLRRSLTARTLTYNTFFNKFMMIMQTARSQVNGFYYSLSDDLIDWSTPRLMMTTVPLGDCTTSERSAAYPSILDPADTTTNFERPGSDVYLNYVRLNWCGAGSSWDRDLVRTPVRLLRPLRWATGVADGCPGGFDSQSASAGGAFSVDESRDYSGAPAAHRANLGPGGGNANGVFGREGYPVDCAEADPTARPTFKYSAGNDIWYSAAFLVPREGFWDRARGKVTLLRFDNGPAGDDAAGVLSVGADDRLHFETDPSAAPGDEVEILKSDAADGVPLSQESCWHFVEVHQRLGNGGAVNEVWLDGKKQTTVTGADNYHGAAYDRLTAGIVSAGAGAEALTVFTDMVGFGYSGPLYSFGCPTPARSFRVATPAAQAAPAAVTEAPAGRKARLRRSPRWRPRAPVRFRARERLRLRP
jgi:hypothetical protein